MRYPIKTLAAAAAAGAVALSLGAAAQAATIFSATIEEDQSTTPSPGFTNQFGQASLALNEDGNGGFTLSMSIDFSGDFDFSEIIASGQIDTVNGTNTATGPLVTGFHIHNAARGQTGGVVFSIFDTRIAALGGSNDTDGDNTLTFNADGSATLVSEWDFQEGTGNGLLADFVTELSLAMMGDDIALYFNLHTAEAASGLIRGQIVAENNAVPVPAALPLFATALLGGGYLRRRKQAKA